MWLHVLYPEPPLKFPHQLMITSGVGISKEALNTLCYPIYIRIHDLVLNYAVTPKEIPTLDTIAATEANTSHLDEETAQQLRLGVSSGLKSANLHGRT